jgi:hypothetical protein
MIRGEDGGLIGTARSVGVEARGRREVPPGLQADTWMAQSGFLILGSGTDQILAAAAEHKWTVIDMAADWATIHPDA